MNIKDPTPAIPADRGQSSFPHSRRVAQRGAHFLAAVLLVAGGLFTGGCASEPSVGSPPVAIWATRDAKFTGSYPGLGILSDVPPRAVSQGPAQYPVGFRNARVPGYANLVWILTPDGVPHEVQWVETADVAFGDAAVAAVSLWRFEPAKKNGQPISIRMALRIDFGVRDVR